MAKVQKKRTPKSVTTNTSVKQPQIILYRCKSQTPEPGKESPAETIFHQNVHHETNGVSGNMERIKGKKMSEESVGDSNEADDTTAEGEGAVRPLSPRSRLRANPKPSRKRVALSQPVKRAKKSRNKKSLEKDICDELDEEKTDEAESCIDSPMDAISDPGAVQGIPASFLAKEEASGTKEMAEDVEVHNASGTNEVAQEICEAPDAEMSSDSLPEIFLSRPNPKPSRKLARSPPAKRGKKSRDEKSLEKDVCDKLDKGKTDEAMSCIDSPVDAISDPGAMRGIPESFFVKEKPSDTKDVAIEAKVHNGSHAETTSDPESVQDIFVKQEPCPAHKDSATSQVTNTPVEEFKFSESLSLEGIRKLHDDFCKARGWGKFHLPRNILLAMVGEVGEIAELFQWRNESECGVGLKTWTESERENLEDELADVMIYLVRLANLCRVDIPTAVAKKMKKNEKKYPAEKVWGSAKKYTEYKD